MSEPTEAQKAEAREWAEARCRDLRLSAKFNAEGLARDVLPLIQARDEARAKYQFMIERAADEKLDGYRELGRRAADAENALVAARADADRLAEALRLDEQYENFDCPHDAEHQCRCASHERALHTTAQKTRRAALSAHAAARGLARLRGGCVRCGAGILEAGDEQ